MTGGKIILPKPHKGQQAILADTSRFKMLAAGRRWRKTTLFLLIAIPSALEGKQIFWGAPTYDQCRIGWNEMIHAAGGVANFRQARMEVDFPNSGRIVFRSLDDPDNARGYTADGILIDEAPFVNKQAWYEVLRPVISDTGGWSVLGGTPNGRNWFYHEWMQALEAEGGAAWQIPTLGCQITDAGLIRVPHPLENDEFSWDEALKLYHSMPTALFRQEFMAEFITRSGLIYDNFSRSTHVKERDPRDMQYWGLAIDEGYTNPAVILLIGVDGDGRLHIAQEFYQTGVLQDRVVAQAREWTNERRATAIIVDESAAGLIADLRNNGLRADGHKGRVLDGIAIVQSLLTVQSDGLPRLTIDPSCVNTINEFESYVWKEGKDEPVKEWDHAMDAARYFAHWLYGEEVVQRQYVYQPARIGL